MSVHFVDDLVLAIEEKFGGFDMAKFHLVINFATEIVKPNVLPLDQKIILVTTAIKKYADKTNMSASRKQLFLLPLDVLVKSKLNLA